MDDIFAAISHNDVEKVKEILHNDVNYLNSLKDKISRPKLSYAERRRLTKEYNSMADSGHNVSVTNDLGNTALIQAAGKGNADMCKVLIDNGSDVNAKNNEGQTSLIEAAKKGHAAVCKLMVKSGVDVNAQNNTGHTALMLAAEKGNAKICKLFSEESVNVRNNAGYTAVIIAAMTGNFDVCQVLIESGADLSIVTDVGSTALIEAIQADHSEVLCELLIKSGADLSVKNSDGRTPLSMCCVKGDHKTCNMLIKYGADVNIKDNYGQTALILASLHNHVDICSLLAKSGIDLNAQNNAGHTALIMAARRAEETSVCRVLIQFGADVSIKNEQGNTALIGAAENGCYDICEMLIKSGANVNERNDNGESALMWASKNTYMKTCELLIESGADMNVETSDGWTIPLARSVRPESSGKGSIADEVLRLMKNHKEHHYDRFSALRRRICSIPSDLDFHLDITYFPLTILNDTDIESLKECSDNCKSATVKVNCRDIEVLPVWLGIFKNVEVIHSGKLYSPPQRIVQRGSNDIAEFLRALAKDHISIRSLNVMVTGPPSAGKTSLWKSLKEKRAMPQSESAHTVGMDIEYYAFNLNEYGTGVDVHIRDVAGQEVYAETFGKFCLPKALNLYVFDLSRVLCHDECDGLARVDENNSILMNDMAWFNRLQHSCAGPAVTLIGTHLDKVPLFRIAMDLRKRSLFGWVPLGKLSGFVSVFRDRLEVHEKLESPPVCTMPLSELNMVQGVNTFNLSDSKLSIDIFGSDKAIDGLIDVIATPNEKTKILLDSYRKQADKRCEALGGHFKILSVCGVSLNAGSAYLQNGLMTVREIIRGIVDDDHKHHYFEVGNSTPLSYALLELAFRRSWGWTESVDKLLDDKIESEGYHFDMLEKAMPKESYLVSVEKIIFGAKSSGIFTSDNEVKAALNFLHEDGKILYFGDYLSPYVSPNPSVVMDALKRITVYDTEPHERNDAYMKFIAANPPPANEDSGKLSFEHIHKLFTYSTEHDEHANMSVKKDEWLLTMSESIDDTKILLELLKAFHVIFDSGNDFIVPCILNKGESVLDWDSVGSDREYNGLQYVFKSVSKDHPKGCPGFVPSELWNKLQCTWKSRHAEVENHKARLTNEKKTSDVIAFKPKAADRICIAWKGSDNYSKWINDIDDLCSVLGKNVCKEYMCPNCWQVGWSKGDVTKTRQDSQTSITCHGCHKSVDISRFEHVKSVPKPIMDISELSELFRPKIPKTRGIPNNKMFALIIIPTIFEHVPQLDGQKKIELYKGVFGSLRFLVENVIIVSDALATPKDLLSYLSTDELKAKVSGGIVMVFCVTHGIRFNYEPALCLKQSRVNMVTNEWENVLPVSELGMALRNTGAESVVLVLEACHGGFADSGWKDEIEGFVHHEDPPAFLCRAATDDSIRGFYVLTSTSPDQVGHEGSHFTKFVTECLRGRGWVNENGYVTASLFFRQICHDMPKPPTTTAWRMEGSHDFVLSPNPVVMPPVPASKVDILTSVIVKEWEDDIASLLNVIERKVRNYDEVYCSIAGAKNIVSEVLNSMESLANIVRSEAEGIPQGKYDYGTPSRISEYRRIWEALLMDLNNLGNAVTAKCVSEEHKSTIRLLTSKLTEDRKEANAALMVIMGHLARLGDKSE